MVHRCIGALVHWCIGASVHWCIGALVHWCMGALVQLGVTCCPLSQTSQSLEKASTGSSGATSSRSRPTCPSHTPRAVLVPLSRTRHEGQGVGQGPKWRAIGTAGARLALCAPEPLEELGYAEQVALGQSNMHRLIRVRVGLGLGLGLG